jgi:hypothetical protein
MATTFTQSFFVAAIQRQLGERCVGGFLLSASKTCGVALANTVAAVADFKNERRLMTASS